MNEKRQEKKVLYFQSDGALSAICTYLNEDIRRQFYANKPDFKKKDISANSHVQLQCEIISDSWW